MICAYRVYCYKLKQQIARLQQLNTESFRIPVEAKDDMINEKKTVVVAWIFWIMGLMVPIFVICSFSQLSIPFRSIY